MLANNVGVSRSSRIVTIVLLTGLLVIVLCCYRKSGGGGSVNPSKMDPLEIEKAMKGVVGTNQCVTMASCSDSNGECELRRVELLKRDEDENRMLFDIEGLTPDDIRTLNNGDGVEMVEENETTTHTITWDGSNFSFTEATEATEATYTGPTLIGTYTNNSSGEDINITKTTTDQKPEALEMYLKDRKAAIEKFDNLANNTEYAVNDVPTTYEEKDTTQKLQWIYNNRDKIVKKTTGTCQDGGYCCPTEETDKPAIKDSIVLEDDNGNVFLNSYQGTLTAENRLNPDPLTNSVKLCNSDCNDQNRWHLYNRPADDNKWNAVNEGTINNSSDVDVKIYPLKPNPYAVDNAISDRLNSWSCGDPCSNKTGPDLTDCLKTTTRKYQDDDSIMSDGRQKCDPSGNIELATDNFKAKDLKGEDGRKSGNVVLKAGGGIGTLGLPCNQHSDCHRFYTNVCDEGHCSAPFMDSTNFMEFPNSRFYTTASPRVDTDP